MGLELELVGSEKLRRLASEIKLRGDQGLGREMNAALKKATEPVRTAIRSEYTHLPHRGGYAGDFTRSLRFRTQSRAGARQASFRLITFADGVKERRDIGLLERGQLRHPVYGRSRPGRKGERRANPWAITAVRGGFHERGTADAMKHAESQMGEVLEDFAHRLIK